MAGGPPLQCLFLSFSKDDCQWKDKRSLELHHYRKSVVTVEIEVGLCIGWTTYRLDIECELIKVDEANGRYSRYGIDNSRFGGNLTNTIRLPINTIRLSIVHCLVDLAERANPYM
uniref:Uncharacterized protein n=2 Tax=Oryza TaxID=4527 RepID=A0A679BBB4_ORYNI|nr:hypothetical protein [Oryza sativa Indica Group]BBF89905.1 hypothetical protein [Oryza sativa f. spontanea]BBF89909.1 hypothetical protein [Oryza sativa f. spontanea]